MKHLKITTIFVIIICCLFMATQKYLYAGEYSQGNSAGSEAGNSILSEIGSGDQINQRMGVPLTSSGTPMKTFGPEDQKEEFGAQISAPSSDAFFALFVQPSGTGDLSTVEVRQDLDYDGNPDYVYALSFPVSGVCANGVISCTPGTWNNCHYFTWSTGNDGKVALNEETSIGSLAGCYCINSSCGSNLVWNNLAIVLKDMGGAAVTSVQNNDPHLTITSVRTSENAIYYYGQKTSDAGTASQGDRNYLSGSATPEDYYGGNIPTDDEVFRQAQDPDSYYSQLVNSSAAQDSSVSIYTCTVKHNIIINHVTQEISNSGQQSVCMDHYLYGRIHESGSDNNIVFYKTVCTGWEEYCDDSGCDEYCVSYGYDQVGALTLQGATVGGKITGSITNITGSGNTIVCNGGVLTLQDATVSGSAAGPITKVTGNGNEIVFYKTVCANWEEQCDYDPYYCWDVCTGYEYEQTGVLTLQGATVSGSAATTDSITKITGGHTIDFQWLGTSPEGYPGWNCGSACQDWQSVASVNTSAAFPPDSEITVITFSAGIPDGGGCSAGSATLVMGGASQIIATCGAAGAQSPTLHWSYSIEAIHDNPGLTVQDNCNPAPNCRFKEEKVCDENGENCVQTRRNFGPTGLAPMPYCKTIDAIGHTYTACMDGGSATVFKDGDAGQVLGSGENIWWHVERTYQCETDNEYDFDNLKQRTQHISDTTQDDTTSMYYEDYNPDTGMVEGHTVELFDRGNFDTCEKGCKVRRIVQDTQATTSGTTADYRTSVSSYEDVYRVCVNGSCPVSDGETILVDCSCIDESSKAISLMQVMDDASHDMICSND